MLKAKFNTTQNLLIIPAAGREIKARIGKIPKHPLQRESHCEKHLMGGWGWIAKLLTNVKNLAMGCVVVSVLRAWESSSWSHEFKPHVEITKK